MSALDAARRDGFIPGNSEEVRTLIVDFGGFGRRLLVVMMEAVIAGGNGTYDVGEFIRAAADPQTPEQWQRCWGMATRLIARLGNVHFEGAIQPGKCGEARPSELVWYGLSAEEREAWGRKCRYCRKKCRQSSWNLLPVAERIHTEEAFDDVPAGALIQVTLLQPSWLEEAWPVAHAVLG